mmetsp:Transcript_58993/g.179966  ORF Transcript_58993/g.179966 Transcript_58993/m.179966 type:complete len:285 (-) Transcript_58993:4308-5162(-)
MLQVLERVQRDVHAQPAEQPGVAVLRADGVAHRAHERVQVPLQVLLRQQRPPRGPLGRAQVRRGPPAVLGQPVPELGRTHGPQLLLLHAPRVAKDAPVQPLRPQRLRVPLALADLGLQHLAQALQRVPHGGPRGLERRDLLLPAPGGVGHHRQRALGLDRQMLSDLVQMRAGERLPARQSRRNAGVEGAFVSAEHPIAGIEVLRPREARLGGVFDSHLLVQWGHRIEEVEHALVTQWPTQAEVLLPLQVARLRGEHVDEGHVRILHELHVGQRDNGAAPGLILR